MHAHPRLKQHWFRRRFRKASRGLAFVGFRVYRVLGFGFIGFRVYKGSIQFPFSLSALLEVETLRSESCNNLPIKAAGVSLLASRKPT